MAYTTEEIEAYKREVHEFIAARRIPCQVCGVALWRHVEERAGHKFVKAAPQAPRG